MECLATLAKRDRTNATFTIETFAFCRFTKSDVQNTLLNTSFSLLSFKCTWSPKRPTSQYFPGNIRMFQPSKSVSKVMFKG